MSIVLEEQTIQTDEPTKSCPSAETHRWDDDFKVGDFCDCRTWECIEILTRTHIVVMDKNGIITELEAG